MELNKYSVENTGVRVDSFLSQTFPEISRSIISKFIKLIKVSVNGKNITKYRNLQLTIEDNLAGVWKYKAYINEAWALMTYNKRKKRYVIPLDARSKPLLRKGENKIRIYANDGKGNERDGVWTVVY